MPAPPIRTRLILNGKKADRADVRDAVARVRRAGHPLEVRVTWEGGDAARLVTEASREGVDRIVVGGGDGSVNEIANGLMTLDAAARPELGILPLGTANDFATACGLPREPAPALLLAATGTAAAVDLGRANDAYFANIAAGGFGAAVTADTPVELKNFLGGGAYTIMGLVKALDFRPYACSIRTAEGAVEGSVVVGGERLAAEVMGLAPPGQFVMRLRAAWIEIEAREPLPVNLDGEPFRAPHIRFAVVPRCLRLVLPADCPCLSRPAG